MKIKVTEASTISITLIIDSRDGIRECHRTEYPMTLYEAIELKKQLSTTIDKIIPCTPKQPKFKRGDFVKKRSGSHWQGHIVGEYSTLLTLEGYAVESDFHDGSVQIYPVAALELC